MDANVIYNEDCLQGLRKLPSESVSCCVTSPPYYGLRDYGVDGQIGLEDTPEEYVQRLVAVFCEVRRVLRADGTLWLNIGDSYAGSGKGAASYPDNAKRYKQGTNRGMVGAAKTIGVKTPNCKPKDLIGIPWMLAFALRADGWYLRQDIIWSKPNPMPESVTDRCTKSHEYIFLLSKSRTYYFDSAAIREPRAGSNNAKVAGSKGAFGQAQSRLRGSGNKEKKYRPTPGEQHLGGSIPYDGESPCRNKRDVWAVGINPYKGAHFATFPPDLIEPCILAGCPVDGIVLDPFMGSGTTGYVANKLGRNFIGYEINPAYIEIAKRRILCASHQLTLAWNSQSVDDQDHKQEAEREDRNY